MVGVLVLVKAAWVALFAPAMAGHSFNSNWTASASMFTEMVPTLIRVD